LKADVVGAADIYFIRRNKKLGSIGILGIHQSINHGKLTRG
jgi:hypothetical protein